MLYVVENFEIFSEYSEQFPFLSISIDFDLTSILEITEKEKARRSVVAIKNILQGDIFSEKNLGLRRPGYGLPPKMIFELFGKKSKKEIMKGKLIDIDDFQI